MPGDKGSLSLAGLQGGSEPVRCAIDFRSGKFHYSQFLSLQLKARMEDIPTPVYGLQKVHQLSRSF
jgi:hypothetical protein